MNRIISAGLLMAGLFALPACAEQAQTGPDTKTEAETVNRENLETAIFAAGCFWCVEQAFDEVPGVKVTTSGYTGGNVADPTYKQVTAGGTGHTEAVEVLYDPRQVGYERLLEEFWLNVDPTDDGGQFCDRGNSYRSGIFPVNERQAELARSSKQALQNRADAPSPIVTEITMAKPFYDAEAYHQDYYKKNPLRYKFYKTSCGRTARLEELWGERAGGTDP